MMQTQITEISACMCIIKRIGHNPKLKRTLHIAMLSVEVQLIRRVIRLHCMILQFILNAVRVAC